MLLEHAGHIVSRQDLARKVLERSYSPFDRSVDVHISNIRKKLGPLPEGEERIKTIRGEGYLYVLREEGES
jgi:two-component system response regulator CpxR